MTKHQPGRKTGTWPFLLRALWGQRSLLRQRALWGQRSLLRQRALWELRAFRNPWHHHMSSIPPTTYTPRTQLTSRPFRALWILCFGILVAGCSGGGNFQTDAVLLTNIPWLNIAAEQYNAQDPQIRIQVRPSTDMRRDLESPDIRVDAMIGTGITYPQILPLYSTMNDILQDLPKGIEFYQENSIVFSREDQIPRALPLAFDAPVAVFLYSPANLPRTQEGLSHLESMSLEIDELATLAARHNRLAAGAYNRIGYDPGWDDVFLMAIMSLFSVDFRANPQLESRLSWNEENLETTIRYLRQWHGEGGPTAQAVETFNRRIGYDPWFQMILDGRIAYRVMGFSDFLRLDDQYRSQLQFRWISRNGHIPALEEPVYAAVPVTSQSSLGASRFISWLKSSEGIQSTMDAWLQTRLPGLHFLGGLPVTPDNESWHQEFFPGTPIPEQFNLVYSPQNPAQWDRIQKEVLLPWIRNQITLAPESPVQFNQLRNALEAWQRLHRQE